MTKKYELTKEHKAMFPAWRDKWIANAMSTKAMDDEEREKCREAVKSLYRSANLTPPPDHRIVFVPSPFVLRFAAGFACAIWYMKNNKTKSVDVATRDAIDDSTRDATSDATRDAIDAATRDATGAATYHETVDAIDPATGAAIDDAIDTATYVAIDTATYDATIVATRAAIDVATHAATRDATRYSIDDATDDAIGAATYHETVDAIGAATDAATRAATGAAIDYATEDSIDDATSDATRDSIDDSTGAETYHETIDATIAATVAAIDTATYVATGAATYHETVDAIGAATRDATGAATRALTRAATENATYHETVDAIDDATDIATCDATYHETVDAIDAATDAATRDATGAATRAAMDKKKKGKNNWFNLDVSLMVNLSKKLGVGEFGLKCCVDCYWRMYQGGNQWSGWSAFLTFFRYIAKLPLDYSKFDAFEYLSEHSGPRIMHKEFCMISDRPEILKVDDQNRPHSENGPFCKWRDGTALYAWHGIYIPEWWITNKDELTPEIALKWENVEQRRAACEMLGWANVLEHPSLNPKIINEDQPHIGTLIEVDLPDAKGQWFLKYQCGTGRWFAESVNDKSFNTALKANAGGNGWRGVGNPEDYIPFYRT